MGEGAHVHAVASAAAADVPVQSVAVVSFRLAIAADAAFAGPGRGAAV